MAQKCTKDADGVLMGRPRYLELGIAIRPCKHTEGARLPSQRGAQTAAAPPLALNNSHRTRFS